MAELIVVGFKKDMYRASDVLNELQGMNEDWDRRSSRRSRRLSRLQRQAARRPELPDDHRRRCGLGRSVGLADRGLALAIPFTGGASAAVAAGQLRPALSRWRSRCGSRRPRCVVVEG